MSERAREREKERGGGDKERKLGNKKTHLGGVVEVTKGGIREAHGGHSQKPN